MSLINGIVDFNNWNQDEKINITKKSNLVEVNNSFLSINLKIYENEKVDDKYLYDEDEKILILCKGRIITKNNSLIDLLNTYKKSLNNFLDFPGFFSVVIVDFNTRKVFLVNDTFGIFKQYYSFEKKVLKISTNYSAFNSDKRKISEKGLAQFLLINYYIDENTIYENVKRTESSTIYSFGINGINKNKYFNLIEYLKEDCSRKTKISIDETAEILLNILNDYTNNKFVSSLTSGFDSRLLLAAHLRSGKEIDTFTFGVKNNIEFKIAQKVSIKIKLINNYKIELGEELEKYFTSYFEYIHNTQNLELNFNRFHYLYAWNKIKSNFGFMNVLTGTGGDSFVRNGFSLSYKSNNLIFGLLNTKEKNDLIERYVESKKNLLAEAGLNYKNTAAYFIDLFKELNDDKYFNHFWLKINCSLRNYFSTEINLENEILPTYPVFLDIRYLTAIVQSGYSIFTNNFLDNPYHYKNISHTYYYELIKYLYNDLNSINTNRGFPLKYLSSEIYLPLRVMNNLRIKLFKPIPDLNYAKWRNAIPISLVKSFSFDDSLKLKNLSTLI